MPRRSHAVGGITDSVRAYIAYIIAYFTSDRAFRVPYAIRVDYRGKFVHITSLIEIR